MKKITFILSLIATFLFQSCSKDNTEPIPTPVDSTSNSYHWYYVAKDLEFVNASSASNLYYFNSKDAFIGGYFLNEFSNDGGVSWAGGIGGVSLGYGFSVNNNVAWIEKNYTNIYGYDHDNNNNSGDLFISNSATTIPYLTDRQISGLYNWAPRRGYILTQDGSIFKVNGSFNPGNIKLEFQTSYINNLNQTASSNIYYRYIEAFDSSNFVAIGNPKVGDVFKKIIIHKHAGQYSELDVSNTVSGGIDRIQYVSPNTAYLHTDNKTLYKFSGVAAVTQLNSPATGIGAFKFKNNNIGFAGIPFIPGAVKGVIYKTTDAGNCWTTDFTLDIQHQVDAFFIKGEEVWAVGHYGSPVRMFIVKYGL